jgi:hypothetical protein
MLSGTQMVKIRSNTRLYERYFWLNEETSSIHWEPSKKDAATLHLSCVKEVRWGQTTDSFKSADPEGSLIGKFDIRRDYVQEAKKCFSIIYYKNSPNLDTKTPTSEETGVLDLMVDSVEMAEIWVLGLTLLMITKMEKEPVRAIRDLIEKVENMRSVWLSQIYHQRIHSKNVKIEDNNNEEQSENQTIKITQNASVNLPPLNEPHLTLTESVELLLELLEFASLSCVKKQVVQSAVKHNINT